MGFYFFYKNVIKKRIWEYYVVFILVCGGD